MPLIHQRSQRRVAVVAVYNDQKSWSNTVDTDTVNTEPQQQAPAMCSTVKKEIERGYLCWVSPSVMGYPGSSSIRYLVKITDLKTIIFIAIVKENKNKELPILEQTVQ
jgi:GTP-dependent phosphoenolpyruvate carboxykinase